MLLINRRNSPPMEGGSDGEGGYLASASDLMIGLLFIFIILVVMLALEQRKQQAAIQEQRSKVVGAGDPLILVTKTLGDALKRVLPKIKVNEKTGVVSLPEDVLFPRGSAVLSPSGAEVLAQAAVELVKVMPCFASSEKARLDDQCQKLNPYGHQVETLFIEGHTDSVPFAQGGKDNFSLSLDRARAVDRALVAGSGLASFRNKAGQPLFSFSAYADTRPLPGTESTDGVNRRVDLRIVLSYKPIGELIPALQGIAASAP
jgi:chemotaxis protein MotB